MKKAAATATYVTATGLGKLFDPVLKPTEVNQKLREAGFHALDVDGKTWRATDLGEEYCLFIKMSDTGMNKWDPQVAAILGANDAPVDKHAYVEPAAAKKPSLGPFGGGKRKRVAKS